MITRMKMKNIIKSLGAKTLDLHESMMLWGKAEQFF